MFKKLVGSNDALIVSQINVIVKTTWQLKNGSFRF